MRSSSKDSRFLCRLRSKSALSWEIYLYDQISLVSSHTADKGGYGRYALFNGSEELLACLMPCPGTSVASCKEGVDTFFPLIDPFSRLWHY